jgi:hypothetical protein
VISAYPPQSQRLRSSAFGTLTRWLAIVVCIQRVISSICPKCAKSSSVVHSLVAFCSTRFKSAHSTLKTEISLAEPLLLFSERVKRWQPYALISRPSYLGAARYIAPFLRVDGGRRQVRGGLSSALTDGIVVYVSRNDLQNSKSPPKVCPPHKTCRRVVTDAVLGPTDSASAGRQQAGRARAAGHSTGTRPEAVQEGATKTDCRLLWRCWTIYSC